MDYERLEFVDAIEDLADQHGQVPREEGQQAHDHGMVLCITHWSWPNVLPGAAVTAR